MIRKHLLRLRRAGARLLAALLTVLGLFALLNAAFPLPPLKPYSSVIEDRHGAFLQAFLAADGRWRLQTSPAEIPDRLKNILVRREDRWFYVHPGINPFAVARAAIQNVIAGRRVSGASTITMQIARMLEPKERTYFHKGIEVFRALQLEWKYSKRELLEMYLSMIPLGGNVEGLKSAALLYYQTPLERLNIAQLFDLTLIPSDPNGLAPDRNPGRLLDLRRRQARRWIAAGYFTRSDSAAIWNTDAAASRRPLSRYAPHFCLQVRARYPDRTEIRSSLDLPTQRTVEQLLSNHLRPWRQKGVPNGAVMVIDNATREVVAYAGSENFDDSSAHGQVDAVQALRSPGSTLKPLLYALLMDRGELTPRTRLLDTPYDAEGFLAENYDGSYSGLVYADEALQKSLNVPMVRLLKDAGLPAFIDFAARAGISSLESQKSKLGLSVILGGCGVTLEELTGAYASFPAGGKYAAPGFLARGGEEPGREVQAFSASTAYMVTGILEGLNRPDVPNNAESAMNVPRVAFKTGTSYGRRDAWSIGYSRDYTVGVWAGDVTMRGCADLMGSRAAAPLLFDILNSISTARGQAILSMPGDVGVRLVCAESGLLPNGRCSRLIQDLYSISRTLDRQCPYCMEYLVSQDGTVSYCPTCLGTHHYRAVTMEDYPAELLNFWKSVGIAFPMAPPHNPLCTRAFSGDGPTIVSPSEAMVYYVISHGQQLALQATSGLDIRHHAWYLDDAYLGRRPAGDLLFVPLREGNHTVTCLDDKGRATSVHFTVKGAEGS